MRHIMADRFRHYIYIALHQATATCWCLELLERRFGTSHVVFVVCERQV